MKEIILIAHDLRSTHNVGSLLRTAEGLGVKKVFFTGYTPYPASSTDARLPHISTKLDKQIIKTALGAETMINWQHADNIEQVIHELRDTNYQILALEQSTNSDLLPDFVAEQKIALIVGREAEGIEAKVLELCDKAIEIPMIGEKESFNVVQAAAMALYHMRYVR